MWKKLSQELKVEVSNKEDIVASDHVFDAVVCALAGMDFFTGNVFEPKNREVAEREGWIWFKKPDEHIKKKIKQRAA